MNFIIEVLHKIYSYGSVLPTSLTYIVPSTRGCSPWRPDAVIGMTGHENRTFPRIFTGRRERTGHHNKYGALQRGMPEGEEK